MAFGDAMKTLPILGLGAALCAAPAIAADTGGATPPEPAAVTVAADANRFAFDLYGRLRSQEKGNLFFSPQSISTALAMTYAGARGETAAEMARTMHFSLPQDRLPAGYAALLAALRGGSGTQSYRLSIANRLWGQRGLSFLEPFIAVTRTSYGAELGLADFKTDAEGARGEINGWVAQETEQKIRDSSRPGCSVRIRAWSSPTRSTSAATGRGSSRRARRTTSRFTSLAALPSASP